MPVLRNFTVLELARGVKAYLALQAGITRGSVPELGSETVAGLQQTRTKPDAGDRRLAEKDREIAALRRRLSRGDTEPVEASRTVWIFGSGRSGSTWLRSMMGGMPGHRVWEEPMVGALFGDFYSRAQAGQLASRNFILGKPARDDWLRSVRRFVLDGARRARPELGDDEFLVVKEPNGSSGAPLLMEALPEARMVLLVRDPRDVVASVLDAAKEGSWLYERKSKGAWKEKSHANTDPNFVKRRAELYVYHVGKAKAAYEAHAGPKALVRYEELRADALGAMEGLYSRLGMDVDGGQLSRAVASQAWESIPAEERGEGKFYRKATPGSWREDLSAEQARIVERITAPLLQAFYPETSPARPR